MQFDIILIQFGLAIILFLIINWIGKHSYSVGYMEISMFLKVEESPAFNFLFRIITPIVYLFITSACLYKLTLDRYVSNYYMVSVYYIVFRLCFNLITNRALLMNWFRQFIYWISIITLSYFSYINIISQKENILPDFSSMTNELWVIILIFIFHTFNRIRFSSDKTVKRKETYLNNRYYYFEKKYKKYIDKEVSNHAIKSIVYSIIIYEDFNRPKIIRSLEYISFHILKREHSLGLMQVKSSKYIDDKKSVKLGIKKINNAYIQCLNEENLFDKDMIKQLLDDACWIEIKIKRNIIKDYNPDDNYINEVKELSEVIFTKYMPNNKTYLFPTYDGKGKH